MTAGLAKQSGGCNGEDKRFGRHPFSWGMLQAGACVNDRWLFLNRFDVIANLMITWHSDSFPVTLGQFFREFFESHILKDSHHRGAERLGVEFPDELLQFRVKLSLTMIGPMRNTGDLPQFLGPAHQATKRRTRNAMCFRDRSQTHS